MANSKSKYYIGQTIGQLTILEDTGKRNGSGSIIYRCQCDCGNIPYYDIDIIETLEDIFQAKYLNSN